MKINWFLLLPIVLIACEENKKGNGIGFESLSEELREDAGKFEIKILLDRASEEVSSLGFALEGEAILGGDYRVNTTSPVNIPRGAREAVIEIELLDESIIESEEEIVVTLNAAGSGLTLNTTKKVMTLTIDDNDESPDEGIQVDLSWSVNSSEDIDDVNLDLFIAKNLIIENNVVQDFDVHAISENTTGFETVWLAGDAPDGVYYLVAYYKTGNKEVNFTLEVNGAGFSHEAVDGDFTSAQSGRAVFYGPLTKEGSSITRTTQRQAIKF